jgi:hypothetical protein
MRRVSVSLLLGVLALLLVSAPASAGRAWCRTDPIMIINGQIADLFVSSSLTAPLQVTGPTQVVVTLPQGVSFLAIPDLGFLHGEKVTVKRSDALHVTSQGIEVMFDVYVPAKTTALPVEVDFAPRVLGILWPTSASGTSNQWIHLAVTF